MLVAVRDEGRTRDVLERKIRLAVFGQSGVEEPRDVGMIQARENSPLAGQPLREPEPHQCRRHELQGYATLEQAVDALREPNAAHATMPEQRANAVRPEPPPDQAPLGLGERGNHLVRPREYLLDSRCSGLEQFANLLRALAIASLEIGEPPLTSFGFKRERGIEQLRDPRVLRGRPSLE